jgi:DnaJ like chaperone protein
MAGLMSQHHPGKLIARIVPEEMLGLGTQKPQEIQATYEWIRRQRRSGD